MSISRPNMDTWVLTYFMNEVIHKLKQLRLSVFDQSVMIIPANTAPTVPVLLETTTPWAGTFWGQNNLHGTEIVHGEPFEELSSATCVSTGGTRV